MDKKSSLRLRYFVKLKIKRVDPKMISDNLWERFEYLTRPLIQHGIMIGDRVSVTALGHVHFGKIGIVKKIENNLFHVQFYDALELIHVRDVCRNH